MNCQYQGYVSASEWQGTRDALHTEERVRDATINFRHVIALRMMPVYSVTAISILGPETQNTLSNLCRFFFSPAQCY